MTFEAKLQFIKNLRLIMLASISVLSKSVHKIRSGFKQKIDFKQVTLCDLQ